MGLKFRWVRILIIAVGIATFAIAVKPLNLQDYLHHALLWVQHLGATGAIVFMAIYILATILLIPGSLLTLGGGAIFGVVLGSIYVFSAAAIGATLAFWVGRYLTRDWVFKQIAAHPKFQAIDDAIGHEGFKIVILTRLSPIFPFNLLNYTLGVTQVSLKDYLLGFVGMLPGTVTYVYIGSLAGSLASLGSPSTSQPQTQMLQWTIQIIGLIATVVVTLYITRIARQALTESLIGKGEGMRDEG